MMTPDRVELIKSRIEVRTKDECWHWTGKRSWDGYGRVRVDGRDIMAHRAVWLIEVGPIPEEMFVCHRCDNRLCVNPEHLFLGTHDENMQDMVKKRRQRAGERHPSAKLSAAAVRAIRQDYANGLSTQQELAARFGVAPSLIHRVIHGESWRSVA
jgi:hypothetical protein